MKIKEANPCKAFGTYLTCQLSLNATVPSPSPQSTGAAGRGGQGAESDHMPFRYQVRDPGVDPGVCAQYGSGVKSGNRHHGSDPVAQQ